MNCLHVSSHLIVLLVVVGVTLFKEA